MPYSPTDNPYIPGDPYSYDLKWIVSEIKRIRTAEIKNANEIEILMKKVQDLINNPNISQAMIQQALDEMYQAGLFDIILSRIVNDFEYTQPDLTSIYSTLDEYIAELDALAGTSTWLNVTTLTTTPGGDPMKCYMIGKLGAEGVYYRKGLIFADQHAREYQGTFLLVNAIKMIVENLEADTGSIHGIKFSDIFDGYKLFIIPTANPDGYKLTMEDSYYDLPAAYQASIASMVEDYIQSGRANNTNDYTPAEYVDLLDYCGGDVTDYVFRAEDIPHVWKANLDGIDLHYNSYNSNTESVLQAWAADNNWPTQAAPQGYIGSSPFEAAENAAIKTLISSEGITSVLDLHQRGPTMFYLYGFGGVKAERNKYISQMIADATQTPVNNDNNAQVGFMGWFHNQYPGNQYYGALKEIGWSSTKQLVNKASMPLSLDPMAFFAYPLPRDMQPLVYNTEINGILEFIAQAVNNQAIHHFHMSPNLYDVNISYTTRTLHQIVNDYDYDCIITISWDGSNAPNIKMPGLYSSGKIVIYRLGTFAVARFYSSHNDIWECVITSSTSYNWHLINAYGKRDYKSATSAGNTYTVDDPDGNQIHFFFEPIISVSAENKDVSVAIQRQPIGSPTSYYIFNLTAYAASTVSTGIYWQITAKEYPSA